MEFTNDLLSIIIGHVLSIKGSDKELEKLSELPINSETCIDKECELSIFLFHRQKLIEILHKLEKNRNLKNYYKVELNTFPFKQCEKLTMSPNGLHMAVMLQEGTQFYSRKRVDGNLKETFFLKDRPKKYYKAVIVDNEGRYAIIECDSGKDYRYMNNYLSNVCKIIYEGKCIEISDKVYKPLNKTNDLEFLMKNILTEKCGLEKYTVCIPDMYKYNGENGMYEPYPINKDITEAYPKKLAELIFDKKYSNIERYEWAEWGTNIRINNTVYYFVFLRNYINSQSNTDTIKNVALMKDITNNGPAKIFLIEGLSDYLECPSEEMYAKWAKFCCVNMFEVKDDVCYFSGISSYLRISTVHALDLEQIYKMKMYNVMDKNKWTSVRNGNITTKIVGTYFNTEKRPTILDDGGLAEYHYSSISFWKGFRSGNKGNTYSAKIESPDDDCFVNVVKGDEFIEVVIFPDIKRYLIPTIALKCESGVVIDKVE